MFPSWRRCFSTRALSLAPARRLRCSQLLNNATQLSAEQSNAPADHASLDGQKINVRGFVKSIRKQKKYAFAQIADGSTVEPIQAIFTASDELGNVTDGSTIDVVGTWVRCPPGKKQSHELSVSSLNYVGTSDPATYPIQKKYHTPEFLRQHPHLRLRIPFNSLMSRLRSEALFAISSSFNSRPDKTLFTQVQPPLITSGDCEGAGEVFSLTTGREAKDSEPFFRSPRYLTVSSQLHLEAYAAELGNVWTISPTFRAEKSDTPRHLSEFYMLEIEMNFLENLDELLDHTESILRDFTGRLYNTQAAQELFTAKRTGESGAEVSADETLRQRWLSIIEGDKWPRVTYTEAIDILQKAVSDKEIEFVYEPKWGNSLQFEHEKFLVDKIGKDRGAAQPLFITDYPRTVKPFYMLPSSLEPGYVDSDKATVACFDLILPGIGEIIGGSMREHRLEELVRHMREDGLVKRKMPQDIEASEEEEPETYPYLEPGETLEPLQWYVDLRRWGSAPHGGWGLGFDRYLGYLSGVNNLRDVVPFPRYAGRADC